MQGEKDDSLASDDGNGNGEKSTDGRVTQKFESSGLNNTDTSYATETQATAGFPCLTIPFTMTDYFQKQNQPYTLASDIIQIPYASGFSQLQIIDSNFSKFKQKTVC